MQVAECLIDTGDFHSALTALSDVSARYCIFLTYMTLLTLNRKMVEPLVNVLQTGGLNDAYQGWGLS